MYFIYTYKNLQFTCKFTICIGTKIHTGLISCLVSGGDSTEIDEIDHDKGLMTTV